jgi:myo-inositol 2-dehydrogenase/D-chiro-inositol 1-dehydrogenase
VAVTGHRVMIRVGFIGCGQVAEQLHLPALSAIRGVEVTALADPDDERLQIVAGQLDDPSIHAHPDSLLNDPSIDVVAVCTPTPFHTEYALKSIDAGKHVFVEKPPALKLEDCTGLVEAARSARGFVTVGFNLRHHHLVLRAKKVIRSGRLGHIRLIRSVACGNWKAHGPVADWRKQVATGGGVLFELGVHHFDLWRFLLDSEIEEISAQNVSDVYDDETAVVNGRMKQGALTDASFAQSTANHNRLDIYGEHGRLCLSLERYDGLKFVSSSNKDGSAGQRLRIFLNNTKELPGAFRRQLRGGGFADSYRAQWQAFCDGIRESKAPECTAEDGCAAVRASLAALAACRT